MEVWDTAGFCWVLFVQTMLASKAKSYQVISGPCAQTFFDQPHLRNLPGSMHMDTGLLNMDSRIMERRSASVVW